MCGISGIIRKDNTPASQGAIKSINDLISHRGPDDEGFYTDGPLAFGHRRLSIIDLSPKGHQPMQYRQRYWITYNGEIYNYLEIREELLALGHTFVSDSDTEVILAAYAEWGSNCLPRFNGMWAFAIYDMEKQEVFLARDRFGVKPLYYTHQADQFVFGSEIKQILHVQEAAYVNEHRLLEALLTRIDGHTEETYFENVFILRQGHFMVYNLKDHSCRQEAYYTLKINDSARKEELDAAAGDLRETFRSAVELRLRSDVRVGTCLSGGLDSSAVSAVASTIYKTQTDIPFTAIHAKSIDQATDESAFAAKTSEFLGAELHVVAPQTSDFVKMIDEVVYTQEEPFGSPSMFMGYHVFQKAKELGCKVMLNGQGGDEVLLGYERYYAAYLKSADMATFTKEMWLQVRNSRLKFFEPILYFFYFTNARLRIKRLLNKSYVKNNFKNTFDFEYIRKSAESYRNIDDMQLMEIMVLQLPHLLRYEDRNSMRNSIETRLPFLDYRLVELAISIRHKYKIRNGWTKYVLRRSLNGILPKDIIWRKNKLGFNAPDKIWLNDHENAMRKEIASSALLRHYTDVEKLLANYQELTLRDRWFYFNIAVWERVYKVKIKKQDQSSN